MPHLSQCMLLTENSQPPETDDNPPGEGKCSKLERTQNFSGKVSPEKGGSPASATPTSRRAPRFRHRPSSAKTSPVGQKMIEQPATSGVSCRAKAESGSRKAEKGETFLAGASGLYSQGVPTQDANRKRAKITNQPSAFRLPLSDYTTPRNVTSKPTLRARESPAPNRMTFSESHRADTTPVDLGRGCLYLKREALSRRCTIYNFAMAAITTAACRAASPRLYCLPDSSASVLHSLRSS